jgi:hypothetical protein
LPADAKLLAPDAPARKGMRSTDIYELPSLKSTFGVELGSSTGESCDAILGKYKAETERISVKASTAAAGGGTGTAHLAGARFDVIELRSLEGASVLYIEATLDEVPLLSYLACTSDAFLQVQLRYRGAATVTQEARDVLKAVAASSLKPKRP